MVRSEAIICLIFSKFSTIHFSLWAMQANVSNQRVVSHHASQHHTEWPWHVQRCTLNA